MNAALHDSIRRMEQARRELRTDRTRLEEALGEAHEAEYISERVIARMAPMAQRGASK